MKKPILIGVLAVAILAVCIILSPGAGPLPAASLATTPTTSSSLASLASLNPVAPLRPLACLPPLQQSIPASTLQNSPPTILKLSSSTSADPAGAAPAPIAPRTSIASSATPDTDRDQAISIMSSHSTQTIQPGTSSLSAPRDDSSASQPAQSLAATSPVAAGPTPAAIIPGAFVTSPASTDPNVAQAIATIRQNFTQALQSNTSDPNSPQYATDWQTAQSLADDLLHERVGDVEFNQIEHDAAQASAAASQGH